MSVKHSPPVGLRDGLYRVRKLHFHGGAAGGAGLDSQQSQRAAMTQFHGETEVSNMHSSL